MIKLGAVYPQTEFNGDPAALDRFAREVERMGFDHLLIYDHVVGAVHEGRDPPLMGPYSDAHPFHEPLCALSYVAAITSRIDLVTGILILPQRQTVLVAKQATEVDLLSGGRLQLGVGAGWNYVEYDALGQDFHRRGKRMDEQIVFLRRLWSEPPFSFKGEFDRLDRGHILPRPKRQIPILVGGFVEATYRRAAKLADGFIFALELDGGTLDGWKRLQQLLREEGRPVNGFLAHYNVAGHLGRGATADAGVDLVRRWEDAGGTHANIITMDLGYSELDQHLDHLKSVLDRVRAPVS
jgi:probable F420-dependent oxidoreductase